MRRVCVLAILCLTVSVFAVANGFDDAVPLKNWPVAFDTLLAQRQVEVARPFRFEVNAVPSAASHFVTVVPCRVLDTRNTGAPVPTNSTATVDVPGSGCGIPAGAAAYSLQFTAMNPADNGYLTAHPTGSVRPTTATLSYLRGGPAFDNAAIVPAGTGGAIDVYVAASLHLIIDINGYFVEGVVTDITAGSGLAATANTGAVTMSVAPGGIDSEAIEPNAITASHIAPGNVVLLGPSSSQARSSSTPLIDLVQTSSGPLLQLRKEFRGTMLAVPAEGGLVAGGNLGLGFIPGSGAGVRLMWYPNKAAFRAGGVSDNQWDDFNIGEHSWAGGRDVVASGDGSFAFGEAVTVSSQGGVGLGVSLNVTGTVGFAAGANHSVTGFAGAALGIQNRADGDGSAALGYRAAACGDYTIALGYRASTSSAPTPTQPCGGTAHTGAFIWGDRSTSTHFSTVANNEFAIRAAGGVRLRTNADATTGCNLPAGSGTFECTSDRHLKTDFQPLDGEEVLRKLATIPIGTWSFISEPGVRRAGPAAQDFDAAFGLGADDRTIGLTDMAGIGLRAIQALEARSDELHAENAFLRDRVGVLEKQVQMLIERAKR